MGKIAAIVVKELKTIVRDPLGLLMLFILPAFFIVVLSVALHGAFSSRDNAEKLDILFVNKDDGSIGSNIAEALEDTGMFRIVTEFDQHAPTAEEAEDAVSEGRYRIAVIVPGGATDAVTFDEDRVVELLIEPILPSEFAYIIESAVQNISYVSIVSALLERNHLTEQMYANKMARFAGRRRLDEGGTSSDVDEFDDKYSTQSTNYLAERGLLVRQHYVATDKGTRKPNAVEQNVPGWTIFALFWIAQVLAITIVGEKNTGAYKRIMVSPITMTEYIVGKTLPYLVINLVQAAFMFGIGIYLLPVLGCHELHIGNYAALAAMTLAISFAANGFGILMASVSRSDAFVATISAALLIVMCVLGGIMVPKFIMPEFMQEMSLYVPQGWAMDGYQNIIVKGHGMAKVLPSINALLLFGAGFFALGSLLLKRTERSD